MTDNKFCICPPEELRQLFIKEGFCTCCDGKHYDAIFDFNNNEFSFPHIVYLIWFASDVETYTLTYVFRVLRKVRNNYLNSLQD